MTDRKPNSKRKPPPMQIDDLSSNEDLSHAKYCDSKTYPLPLMIPQYPIDFQPNVPAFNPLATHSEFLSIYDFESLDDELTEKNKLQTFFRRIQETTPLIKIHDLVHEISPKLQPYKSSHEHMKSSPNKHTKTNSKIYINHESNAAHRLDRQLARKDFTSFIKNQSSDIFIQAAQAYEKSESERLENVKKGEIKANEDKFYILENDTGVILEPGLWKPDCSVKKEVQEDVITDRHFEDTVRFYEPYLSEKERDYLCILISGKVSKQLVQLNHVLNKISILLFQFSELTKSGSRRTILLKRQLIRLAQTIGVFQQNCFYYISCTEFPQFWHTVQF